MSNSACPCLSSLAYNDCCKPLHENQSKAQTPEQLMRSRYSAFVIKKMSYLVQTTHPEVEGLMDHRANADWANSVTFIQLEIIQSLVEGKTGYVEFKAHYKTRDFKMHTHHEHSIFKNENDVWYYWGYKS